MADYYTQSTVSPTNLTLTPMMAAILELRGACFEGGNEDTALDQIVRGDRNRHNTYVYFENGWNFDVEECEDEHPNKKVKLSSEEREEYERLLPLDEAHFFREVLLVNPKIADIRMSSSSTCSTMRPDSFGGQGLYVTRTHYCWVGDGSAEVVNGKIKITAKVQKFKTANPKKMPKKVKVTK